MTQAGSEGFAAATQTHSRMTTVSSKKATAPTHRTSESFLAWFTNCVKKRLLSNIPSVRTKPSSKAYDGAFGSTRSTMVWTRAYPMSSQRTLTSPSSSRLACSRSRLIGVSSLRAARIDGASGTARPTAPPYVLMFDTLTDRLNGVFKKLRSRGKLHPKQVDNALGEMRVALLEADVSVEVVDDLLSRVRARALSEEIMKSLTPGAADREGRQRGAHGHAGRRASPVPAAPRRVRWSS